MQESLVAMRVTAVFSLLLFVVSCQPSDQNTEAAHDRVADEVAIRAQIAANEAAYNNRDAAGVAATYAPDGDHIAFSSPRNKGREAIRNWLEEQWSSRFVEVSLTVDTIRFLSPDVAIAEATAQFANGGHPRGTLVMVRTDDNWLIAAARVLPTEQ